MDTVIWGLIENQLTAFQQDCQLSSWYMRVPIQKALENVIDFLTEFLIQKPLKNYILNIQESSS